MAVTLSGSGGRGEADEWSDLDIHVVAADGESEEVLSNPHSAEKFGDLAVWVDCSFNAAPGGSMTFARYLAPEGLIMVDWHVSPQRLARQTSGSLPLWTRPGFALRTFDGNLVELVMSRPRRQPPPYSRQQRAEWELCMIHIATSRPPRGLDGRDLHKLIGLEHDTGPEPAAQLAGLARHLEKLRPWIAPRALRATEERVDAARRAVGS